MADKISSKEADEGAGVAAYILVLELIGLLEGMGVEQKTMDALIARARATIANQGGESKARHLAAQLLESLERRRTASTPRPN